MTEVFDANPTFLQQPRKYVSAHGVRKEMSKIFHFFPDTQYIVSGVLPPKMGYTNNPYLSPSV